MNKHYLLTGIAATVLAFSACNDETLDIGNSLTGNADKLTVSSASFQVTTKSALADSVLMRSSYCYLGKVKDPETGAYVTSEFMTQFHILETFSLPEEGKIANSYNGMAMADSCQIELYLDAPNTVTDTSAAVKVRVSELAIPMSEDRRYYSNFNPVSEGLVRQGGLVKERMFSFNDPTVNKTSLEESGYETAIYLNLNQPYTDKDGVTYNNYGTYILQQYYRHPEYFKNAYAFVHNVCPGFYFQITDGEGVYTEIPEMCLRFYYQVNVDGDSISTFSTAMAGTEEILQTTRITNEKEVLQQLLDDQTCTYLKAPAGLYTEVTLPIDEIFEGHDNDSIMTAKISFQRINHTDYDKSYKVPTYLLMVPKDSLTTFFENSKLPDNKLTYTTSHQSSTNQYTFSNLSTLVTQLAAQKREGMATDSQWTDKHPNWNKMLLVPVQAITTTVSGSTSVSGYEHCVGIASTKLVGGSQNPYEPVKIDIVYSKFNQ